MSARAEVRQRVRGLYGIADATASGGDPERLAAQLLAGGCRLLQLRCKGWALADVERVARRLVVRCHAVGATFLVNDHAEIAAAVGADGVHVGQLDAATAEVRAAIGPERILGRSTHDLEQVEEAARAADYLAFGPIWPTANAGRPKGVRGIEALKQVRARVSLPLVAIGGIDPDRVPRLIAAGADAWAVIGAVAASPDPVAATRALVIGKIDVS